LVSGNATTSGGASNVIGGGNGIEIPTLTSTPAIVVIGKILINAKTIVPKRNFLVN
jgi:hypothetical protein